MNELKQKSELLGRAKQSLDECIAAGIDDPKCKYENRLCNLIEMELRGTFELYEFHLGIIEGKQVFNGDVLYSKSHPNGYKNFDVIGDLSLYGFSWNPPKPKTVMVEFSIGDAKFFIENGYLKYDSKVFIHNEFVRAFKTLEESK